MVVLRSYEWFDVILHVVEQLVNLLQIILQVMPLVRDLCLLLTAKFNRRRLLLRFHSFDIRIELHNRLVLSCEWVHHLIHLILVVLVVVRLKHVGKQSLDVLRHLLEVTDVQLRVHALDVLKNLLKIRLGKILFKLSFGFIVDWRSRTYLHTLADWFEFVFARLHF